MPRRTIAIAGCAHGEMDAIYATLKDVEEKEGRKADVLLCCGDFQSVRNYGDLSTMHCPVKYQQLQTFHRYYAQKAQAPVLTLFVGGNHEASNYLAELPNGGWVAPNVYYMGFASVLRYRGLRIGGLSGIAGKRVSEFHSGHWEAPPFDQSSKVSFYHVRSTEVFRLRQLSKSTNPMDVFLSHDWPAGITDYGDVGWLLRKKRHFEEDVASQAGLGNPHTMKLLTSLRPRYWFSAHLHVKFPALVPHEGTGEPTRFLALDKCLPHRGFLQLLDVELPEEREGLEDWLSFDPEWLAVLRSTEHLTNSSRAQAFMPGPGMGDGVRYDFAPSPQEVREAAACFPDADLTVPSNFHPTGPTHEDGDRPGQVPVSFELNPQTAAFCQTLGIGNLNRTLYQRRNQGRPLPDVLPVRPWGEAGWATADSDSDNASAAKPAAKAAAAEEEEDLFGAFERPEAQALPTSVISKLRLPPPKAEAAASAAPAGFDPPPIKRPAEKADAEKAQDEPPKPSAAAMMKRRNVAQYEEKEDEDA